MAQWMRGCQLVGKRLARRIILQMEKLAKGPQPVRSTLVVPWLSAKDKPLSVFPQCSAGLGSCQSVGVPFALNEKRGAVGPLGFQRPYHVW